jgi:hypothetical protein
MQTTISNRPGDYNRDGIVNANDYSTWRKYVGSTSDARADGNNDGLVDAADYVIWRKQLDAPTGPTVVFSENFDDITIAADPLALTTSTLGNSFSTNVVPTSSGAANARIDSGDLFGLGSTNQYLELIDGASTAGIRGPAPLSGTGFQVSFDFYDPSGDGATAGSRIILGDGANASNSTTTTRSIDIELRNGVLRYVTGGSNGTSNTAGTYAEDAKHSVVIVGNYSNSVLDYDFGGNQSVATGTYDIWIDGSLLANGDDVPFRNAVNSTTHIGLSGNGAVSLSTSYFDNFLVEIKTAAGSAIPASTSGSIEPMAVPEPGAVVLAGIAVMNSTSVGRRIRSQYFRGRPWRSCFPPSVAWEFIDRRNP